VKAAEELKAISTTIYLKYTDIRAFPLFRDRSFANPCFDQSKAAHWGKVTSFLKGEGEWALLESFLLSQDETSEGLYNIAVALHDNPQVRAAYNSRFGRAQNDMSAAYDFLKHAANLGSSNAAWRYGDIWNAEADINNDADALKNAHYWFSMAAEMGHPNAEYRKGYLARKEKLLSVNNIHDSNYREPSPGHLQKYPQARAVIHVEPADYSFLLDPREGDIRSRIRRARDVSDAQVMEFGAIVQALENKISAMLCEAGQNAARVTAKDGQRDAAYVINTSMERGIWEHDIAIEHSRNKAITQTAANAAASLVLGSLTTSHFNPGIAASQGSASGVDVGLLEIKIAGLTAQITDIGLLDSQQADLTKEIERISKLLSIVELQKDAVATSRVIQGYLRQQVLELADQNCEYTEKYAQRAGINSLDGFLSAFECEGGSCPEKSRIYDSIRNFCLGVADSNDLHVMLAYSDTIHFNSISPVTLHDTALHHFVERHVKPAIDDYIPRSSRIDVLKDAQFSFFAAEGGDLLSTAQALKNPHINAKLGELFQSGFATDGSAEINRRFTFYLHRHGNTVLRATRLDDGLPTNTSVKKKVTVWDRDQQSEFVERTIDFYRHSGTELPAVESIFLRVCAAEYFEPQHVITSGKKASFSDNPQAPVAYPMINDVINEFIMHIGLSPFTTYSQAMHDKAALDGLVAQSFIDCFAVVGQIHDTQFQKERQDLSRAYGLRNYGTRFQDYYNMITDDAVGRYDLFQDVFKQNLQKSLEVNTVSATKEIVNQLQAIKDMGKTNLMPDKLIIPGTPEALQISLRRNRNFENMYPPRAKRDGD
jgi:hypothetical protein